MDPHLTSSSDEEEFNKLFIKSPKKCLASKYSESWIEITELMERFEENSIKSAAEHERASNLKGERLITEADEPSVSEVSEFLQLRAEKTDLKRRNRDLKAEILILKKELEKRNTSKQLKPAPVLVSRRLKKNCRTIVDQPRTVPTAGSLSMEPRLATARIDIEMVL
ncbi:hypothetical protein M0804_014945 [Polistes exclamans]|nr:hypothetical protein M0804_014945 [Polistes exclamans]